MPTAASDDGVVLGLKFDISRVKQTLDQVKNMVQGMAADSAKAVAKTDDVLEKARKNAEKWKIEPTTNGIEAAQKELDILNATIVNQQNELSNCEREHERLADKYGETSSQALKLEKRMLSLQASIEKNTKKSDDFGAALADAQDVMDAASGSAEDLEKNAKGAGKGMEDGGKGAKTFDVALGTLAGNALSAVISKCGELMEQTKELRRDLSFLEQNARDAGMGMEQLHNKAGELYAITGDTNEVVEALSNILATGFNDADKAYEAVDLLAGAVVKFPETMKIESLADSLQETIATGEATGQFSELLGRLDEVLVFGPLAQEDLVAIGETLLRELEARAAQQGIRLAHTPAAARLLVREAYEPSSGARSLRRAITRRVEQCLAQQLLGGVENGAAADFLLDAPQDVLSLARRCGTAANAAQGGVRGGGEADAPEQNAAAPAPDTVQACNL